MMLRVISLGAGVQSSAMLLMALEGRFGDLPHCAIFADTQCEPKEVYDHLNKLEMAVAPFPIYRVSEGDLLRDFLAGKGKAQIPLFTSSTEGKPMMLTRNCTREYKVLPIRRKIREMVGPKGRAESWIGISTDEAIRIKPSGLLWLTNRHPLIEAGISRAACHQYLMDRGFRPVKSACRICPYTSEASRLEDKRERPEVFASTCDDDERMRHMARWHSPVFLHRSLQPLRHVELRHEHQRDLFGNECEGMCGL